MRWKRASPPATDSPTRASRSRSSASSPLAEGLDASGITVEVKDCEATLSGSVRCYADMQRVEQLACAIAGVKQVRNGLASIEPPPHAVADRPVGSAPKMGKPGYER